MTNKTLYIEWFKTILPQITIYITAIILLILLPIKNYWSILFFALSLSLSLKLYSNISSNTKPSWKEYNKTTTATVFFISITSLLYSVGGWFGIFGLGLVIMIFAGYRIYQQFDLFDNLTTYISDVLFKGKSYDFDPLKKDEVKQYETSRQDRRESERDTQSGEDRRVEEQQIRGQESSNVIGGLVVEADLSFLQKQNNIIYTEKPKMESDNALSDVFEDVSTMDKERIVIKKRRKKKKKNSKNKKVVVDG